MESEQVNVTMGVGGLFFRLRNYIAAVILFIAYHWYDALCYAVSNMFELTQAIAIMLVILFLASLLLVWLHQVIGKKYGWDVLGLEELNALKDADIPKRNFWKRFLRWIMLRRWTIYWIGSAIIGPPVVALLLRKNKSWSSMIKLYIIPGTFISVLIWIPVMKGIGWFTWEQYIKPIFGIIN